MLTPLDEVRHALYSGPRASFVARRKDLAGVARSGGDRETAKLIAEMRKPTAAAHLMNLLAHADDSSLRELIELGASIRRAIAEGDDRELRSLLQGRAAAISRTVAQARAIARADGEAMSSAVDEQIVQTLRAAMASDGAAAAVRDGVLTEALDGPGFGDVSVDPAPRAADEGATRAARQARIKAAAAELQQAERELAAATKRRDSIGRDRDRLAEQLAQIEHDLAFARAEIDGLEVQRRAAATEWEAAGRPS
jgi:hypothetical protein